jgi:hypothetical protein
MTSGLKAGRLKTGRSKTGGWYLFDFARNPQSDPARTGQQSR